MKVWKNRKIDLFGDIWEIRFIKDWIKKDDGEGGENWYSGMTYHGPRIIEVSVNDGEKDRKEEDVLLTLAHELMHAFNGSGQYVTGEWEKRNEEPYVEWIAKCIVKCLKSKMFE